MLRGWYNCYAQPVHLVGSTDLPPENGRTRDVGCDPRVRAPVVDPIPVLLLSSHSCSRGFSTGQH